MKTAIRLTLLSTLLAFGVSAFSEGSDFKIELKDGASLYFYDPLKGKERGELGVGWKRAAFINSSGNKIPIFPMEYSSSFGGLIFQSEYPPRISPTGKYLVLDVLRAGIVEPGPTGAPNVATREYCPVLNVASGCIVSMQTGELCGGDWSKSSDFWVVPGYKYDATSAMLNYQFEDANTLWNGLRESAKIGSAHYGIKDAISSNLGVFNLMSCDSPKASNAAAYMYISTELKRAGDIYDAEYVARKLGATSPGEHAELRQIVVRMAFLFDEPDGAHQTKMYLLRGDEVKVLERNGSKWAKVEYAEKNGRIVQKWISANSLN